MYTVNGVALENATRGWSEQFDSDDLAGFSPDVTVLRLHGTDGNPALPADRLAPRVTLVLWTPRSGLEDLYALFSLPVNSLGLASDSSREVAFETLSIRSSRLPTSDEVVEVTIVIGLFEAFWRDSSVSTSTAANLSSASVDVSVFSGLSAPVTDAIVRVSGAAAGLMVTDAGTSWFSYSEAIASGSYLRFHSDTGEAFLTASDTWTGGTEVSGDIDFGGPRGVFEITPSFTDPSTRAGKLTVTTTSRSGAAIQVRGKGAYLV